MHAQEDMQDEQETIQQPLVPLWHNTDYLLLTSGQALSALGTNASQLAFPLLVLFLTGSPAQAGIAGALRALPYFLLCLPAGALIDRWDRKRVMIVCDVFRTLSLLSIPCALSLGWLTTWQLYVNALLEGTCYVLFDLAEAACLPRVVPQAQLTTASAQSGVIGGFTNLIGPVLGGLLYSLGKMIPFIADALGYLASVISLCFIKTAFQEERSSERGSLLQDMQVGLLWLWRQPLLRILAVLTGLVNFVFPDTCIFMVIVLAQRQHATATATGLIFTISSVGYIIGSLFSDRLQQRLRFGHLISGSCWLFALVWLLYICSTNIVWLAAVTTLLSLVDPIYDVAQYSRRSAIIPDALQGRVHAAYRLMALATPPLGLFLAGVLLQIGALTTIMVFGVCLFVLAALATLSKAVREAGPLES